MSMKFKVILIASLLLNVIFVAALAINVFNRPADRVGVLKHDLKFKFGKGAQEQIILPKGLVVEDASPRGFATMGLFDPFRFKIVLMSDDRTLVDYDNFDQRSGSGYYPVSPK